MAKPKQPLLSLGARGTIGDALTYQKRGQDTIVREKPIPKDPYSLNQAYQRWDYRDYAYRWTLLSDSEKQIYRTAASRYHITGFSLWMREHLKELTNLVGRWHLDERSGATAYDSSKNANNGTIFGPTPATGLIDGAYYFDGLNDYIRVPDIPSLQITPLITLECFFRAHSFNGYQQLICKGRAIPDRSYYLAIKDDRIFFNLFLDPNNVSLNPLQTLVVDRWYHVLALSDGTTMYVFLDGEQLPQTAVAPSTITICNRDLYIGAYNLATSSWFHGDIDHPAVHNVNLELPEIKRHSERRYPA